MFKFDFDISDDEESCPAVPTTSSSTKDAADAQPESSTSGAARYRSYSLEELVSKLPRSITFSRYRAPFLPADQTMYRRELFDARFQVMDESESEENETSDGQTKEGHQYIDAETDLIPGTYEGGLKTWEGGLDLVQVSAELDSQLEGGLVTWLRGKRVLEAGCGTAAPTSYLLKRLMMQDVRTDSSVQPITFHLQDYNLSVLQLVTLPNLILAILPDSHLQESESDLDLDDETLDAFFRRLQERNIKLEFSSGDWAELARHVEESNRRYDLVLTAETIYRRESVPGLLRLLRASSIDASDRGSSGRRETPTTICPTEGPEQRIIQLGSTGCLILIAAKVMYFGVGGDLHNFEQKVNAAGGSLLDVKTWDSGVGRKVVRLQWP